MMCVATVVLVSHYPSGCDNFLPPLSSLLLSDRVPQLLQLLHSAEYVRDPRPGL